MKKNIKLIIAPFLLFILMVSCSKQEQDNIDQTPQTTSITLSANKTILFRDENANFTVISNLGTNLNAQSVFYVNNVEITSNTYTFSTAGQYSVKAVYQNLTSNTIQITVEEQIVVATQFVNRVLVEEYSGTWCGNCPRILYGTELLKQQTNKEVSVQIHLFSNDPFINSDGNALATNQGISGVPTGKINRTINWTGPQYQNINQVINEIKPSANVGLAINPALAAGNININLKLGFANTNLQTRLLVYLVEDNLFHTQANYSSNLYGGLSSIPNFEYDGVLRKVVSDISGDVIIVSGNEVQKNYTIPLPPNINNTNNVKVVAFLIDSASGSVLNVREAILGQNQNLEVIN